MGGEGGLNRGIGGWGRIFKEDGCGKEGKEKERKMFRRGICGGSQELA